MKKRQKIISLFSICIIGLTGCFSSTRIYKQDYRKNDSTFVQRKVGAKVFIMMNNGDKYTGELLTVRDSTMLLCERYEASEEELSNSVYLINIINNHSIILMEVEGEHNILSGLAIGTAAGIVVGATIGLANGDDPPSHGLISFRFTAGSKAAIGGCFLGMVGAVIGLVIGAVSSTHDEEIYNCKIPEDYDFTQLNVYSRYGGIEPECLEQIK